MFINIIGAFNFVDTAQGGSASVQGFAQAVVDWREGWYVCKVIAYVSYISGNDGCWRSKICLQPFAFVLQHDLYTNTDVIFFVHLSNTLKSVKVHSKLTRQDDDATTRQFHGVDTTSHQHR